jgi:hypothetical protein
MTDGYEPYNAIAQTRPDALGLLGARPAVLH